MKKLTGFFIVFVIILAAPSLKLYAQNSFEGTLTWSMVMPSIDKFNVIINVKGLKSEMEMNMGTLGSSKMWSDRATRKTYMAMSSVKNGTVQDMGDMTPTASASVDIKPTGKKGNDRGLCRGRIFE